MGFITPKGKKKKIPGRRVGQGAKLHKGHRIVLNRMVLQDKQSGKPSRESVRQKPGSKRMSFTGPIIISEEIEAFGRRPLKAEPRKKDPNKRT